VRSSIPAILRSMPARRLLLLHQRHHGAARVVSSRRPGYAIQFDSERVASLECSGPQDACEILVHALQALVEVDSLNNERLEAARVRLHTLVGRVQNAEATLQRIIGEGRGGEGDSDAFTAAVLRDSLTGLLNRRAFMELAKDAARGTGVRCEEMSLVFLTLDDFKHLSDTHGHTAEDAILVCVADALRSCARRSDLIARWGEKEFVVLLNACSLDQGLLFGERLLKAFGAQELRMLPSDWRVTAAIGIATGVAGVHATAKDLEELIQVADERAHSATLAGEDRVVPDPGLGIDQVA